MNTDPLTIRVECYAGYQEEETPRRFLWAISLLKLKKSSTAG